MKSCEMRLYGLVKYFLRIRFPTPYPIGSVSLRFFPENICQQPNIPMPRFRYM